jgi:hypothetical protein
MSGMDRAGIPARLQIPDSLGWLQRGLWSPQPLFTHHITTSLEENPRRQTGDNDKEQMLFLISTDPLTLALKPRKKEGAVGLWRDGGSRKEVGWPDGCWASELPLHPSTQAPSKIYLYPPLELRVWLLCFQIGLGDTGPLLLPSAPEPSFLVWPA